jgi:predicted Zn-dependent peptidase
MVQAEMVLQSRGLKYNSEITPEIQLFNEYFGGGMSSIVFQELREAQGLAYAVFSSYNSGSKVEDNDYMMAYIGTQADKQKEALDALVNLLNNLPESEKNFENAKKAILSKIESTRITKGEVLFDYLGAQRKNLDHDIRKDVYSRVQEMNFGDLKDFHGKYIRDKKFNIAVIGDRKKMNFVALGTYGEVKELSFDEIFGYKENTGTILN